MKTIYSFILFLFLLFTSCEENDSVSPEVYLNDNISDLIKKEFNTYTKGNSDWKGGVAMLITTEEDSYFFHEGFAEEVTPQTHFRGASTTKTFTATAILLLQDDGLLNIKDKIVDKIPGRSDTYIPDIPEYDIPHKDKITIEMLLNHRAGVFDVSNEPIPDYCDSEYKGEFFIEYTKGIKGQDHTFSFDELVNAVAENQICSFKPDSAFHYSNTGYSILGKIIERVSGKSYKQFISDRILTPNNLTNISFPDQGNDTGIPDNFVPSYFNGGPYDGAEVVHDNVSAHVAEGNVITTLEDHSSYLRKLMQGEIISTSSLAMMKDYKPTRESHQYYGLGCQYTYGLGYGHNGAHAAYLSMMRHDPNDNITIVVFCNFWDFQQGSTSIHLQLDFMYNIARKAKVFL